MRCNGDLTFDSWFQTLRDRTVPIHHPKTDWTPCRPFVPAATASAESWMRRVQRYRLGAGVWSARGEEDVKKGQMLRNSGKHRGAMWGRRSMSIDSSEESRAFCRVRLKWISVSVFEQSFTSPSWESEKAAKAFRGSSQRSANDQTWEIYVNTG